MFIPITNYNHTSDLINHIDLKLTPICISIKGGDENLCDYGEYLIGMGFTVLQQYISSSFNELNIEQQDALNLPPKHNNNLSIAAAIYAGANYWKHNEEWYLELKRSGGINKLSKRTLDSIEVVTPWSDYTCSNLLGELLNIPSLEQLKLSDLLPLVLEWRTNLENKCISNK